MYRPDAWRRRLLRLVHGKADAEEDGVGFFRHSRRRAHVHEQITVVVLVQNDVVLTCKRGGGRDGGWNMPGLRKIACSNIPPDFSQRVWHTRTAAAKPMTL